MGSDKLCDRCGKGRRYKGSICYGCFKERRTEAGDLCRIDKCANARYCTGLCHSHYGIRMKYRLSVEELIELYKVEHCESCTSRFKSTKDRHIDHDHVTGVVRGVLCHACNLALGFLREDVDTIEMLADYVKVRCGQNDTRNR